MSQPTDEIISLQQLESESPTAYPATCIQVFNWQHQQNILLGRSKFQNPEILGFRIKIPDVDLTALRRAIRLLVERHNGLRSIFYMRDGRLWQDTDTKLNPDDLIIIRKVSPESLAKAVEAGVNEAFNMIPDFPTGRLFMALVFHDATLGKALVVILIHHIISDARSLKLIEDELRIGYYDFKAGSASSLQPLRVQLKDVIEKRFNELRSPRGIANISYWNEKLRYLGDLPSTRAGSIVSRTSRERIFFLDEQALSGLLRCANEDKLSSVSLLLACVHLSLKIREEQKFILYTSSIADRRSKYEDKVIGHLVNKVYYKIAVCQERFRDLGSAIFSEMLQSAVRAVMDEELFKDLKVRENTDCYINYDVSQQNPAMPDDIVSCPASHSPYLLSVRICQFPKAVRMSVTYSEQHYEVHEIEMLIHRIKYHCDNIELYQRENMTSEVIKKRLHNEDCTNLLV